MTTEAHRLQPDARNRSLVENGQNTIADRSLTEHLIQKWGRLLEGLPNKTRQQRHVLGAMALIYENERRHLGGLTEETRSVNVGPFQKYIFPVLRKVFPNLIANELFSLQPMTAPVGAIFYLDYVYASTKGPTTAGTIFPNASLDRNYSSEYIDGEILVTGDGTNYGASGGALQSNLAWTPVRAKDATRGFRVYIREINATTSAVVQEAADNGDGTFTFTPTGGSVAGTINYANGAISGFKFQNIPASGNPIKAYYSYDGELNSKQPRVTLDVRSAPVVAEPRRLNAYWSAEAQEDLQNLHGISAEAELISTVSQEMGYEIDRFMLDEAFRVSTGTTGSFDRIPPPQITEHDHLRALYTVVSTVANKIHKKTLRSPANWMVTSPEISALFAQLTTVSDFRPLYVSGDPQSTGMDIPRPLLQQGQFGVYKTGTLMNKLMVYEDPQFTSDFIMLGLRGSSFLDAGGVFAPYIAMQVTPTFMDPADNGFRKGFRTRFAFKITRPDYFGQIRVANL